MTKLHTLYKCDKCKKEFYEVEMFLFSIQSGVMTLSDRRDLHLCPGCNAELNKWIDDDNLGAGKVGGK